MQESGEGHDRIAASWEHKITQNVDSLFYLLSTFHPPQFHVAQTKHKGRHQRPIDKDGALGLGTVLPGAGASEPLPADHGVSPSHSLDDQFLDLFGFPAFLANRKEIQRIQHYYL